MGLYKSQSFNEEGFLFHLNNAYNFFCTTDENVTLIGDFNMIPENKNLIDFCEMNKLEHLILKPACSKVVITWSRLAGMKFQLVQPREISPYDYMWKLNFVLARWDSFPPGIWLDLHAFSLDFSF